MRINHNLLIISLILFSATICVAQKKTKVLLDADTANEVDDAFALSLILMDSSVEVTALNATQWQSAHWATAESMEDSHRLNQMLLGVMGLNLKSNRGGVNRMYDWGDRAQHSSAAYEIINQVKALPEGEKLNLVALGALTNVASAVYIDPSIATKLRLFWLGTSYDFENDLMLRDDFNCTMDQYALTHLLFSEVEMHVIPVNIASKMTFEYDLTKEKIGNTYLGDFLLNIWQNHIDGGRRIRTIWDLSIVYGFLHPEWLEEIQITSSKENGNRKIYYYKNIDIDKIREDFFTKIIGYNNP